MQQPGKIDMQSTLLLIAATVAVGGFVLWALTRPQQNQSTPRSVRRRSEELYRLSRHRRSPKLDDSFYGDVSAAAAASTPSSFAHSDSDDRFSGAGGSFGGGGSSGSWESSGSSSSDSGGGGDGGGD